jgi:hypothetical protein
MHLQQESEIDNSSYACEHTCIHTFPCLCSKKSGIEDLSVAPEEIDDRSPEQMVSFVYIRTYTHTYIYVCVCVYIYIYSELVVRTCMHACMHIYMHERIHVYTFTCMNACIDDTSTE